MRRRITRAEAKAYRKRWEALNAAETKELRATPIARKLQQLSALMAWGRHFGWTEPPADGVEEVRERWVRLVKTYHPKTRKGSN